MKHIHRLNAAALVLGLASVGAAHAQNMPIGAPQDWSNRAVVPGKALTPDELVTAGRSKDITRLYNDPRYITSVMRRLEREAPRQSPLAVATARANVAKGVNTVRSHSDRRDRRHQPKDDGGNTAGPVQRDWQHTIGAVANGKMGVFPAKYNFDIFAAPSCTGDYVAYTTNAATSATQASLVGFNQLYQGTCNGPWNNNGAIKAPNVMWSYTTGAGYITETSPTLSYLDNGKQVAFVQRNVTTGALQLVLLKWQAGQGSTGAPVTPTLSATAAAYRACASGCYFALNFNGTSNVKNQETFSAPFVDYFGDTLWVGDGNGRLHKFTGIFQGQPAEVTSGGFPATVAAGMQLSPPVFANGNVYVGSQSGSGTVGGKLHRVNASTGAVYSSTKLAVEDSSGIRESVIVDLASNSVYAFLFNDGTTGDGTYCQPADPNAGNFDACRTIARFATGFAANASPLQRAYVGRGNSRVSTLYAGGFDDAFYSSADGTGALYIAGGTASDTYIPTLWKVPVTAGVLGNPIIGPKLGDKINCGSQPNCSNRVLDMSPVTVIKNPHTQLEYLYLSMPNYATNLAGCSGACLVMFPLNQAWNNNSPTAGAALAIAGGTGGIVIDNVRPSSDVGASQIYTAALDTGVKQRWEVRLTANNAINTLTINNNVTFTAGSSTSCNSSGGTFDVSGNLAQDDSKALRACLLQANLPGFSYSGEVAYDTNTGTSTGTVIITSLTTGPKANNLVSGTGTPSGASINITQGTTSTAGNAIQASQNGLL